MQDTQLFDHYAPKIRALSQSDMNDPIALRQALCMHADTSLKVCYAPVEYVNPEARVVIVGITPGLTQMVNALEACRLALHRGASAEEALRQTKLTAAFSGDMRAPLIEMLDSVGLHRWLGLHSARELFEHRNGMLQAESVLRYPVFVGGQNYNGTPNMLRHPLLRRQLTEHFGRAAAKWRDAVFVPLGDKAGQALNYLADQGMLEHRRVLSGLPHPSGANNERIAYFLNKKRRQDLSVKVDPDKLDAARIKLVDRIEALR